MSDDMNSCPCCMKKNRVNERLSMLYVRGRRKEGCNNVGSYETTKEAEEYGYVRWTKGRVKRERKERKKTRKKVGKGVLLSDFLSSFESKRNQAQ